jgi:hypothetical protein
MDPRYEGELSGPLLAYATGLINQELLLKSEYLRPRISTCGPTCQGRTRLSDAERATLAEIGKRLGRKALSHRQYRSERDVGESHQKST